MNILLHICCANCAIVPTKYLRSAAHQVTGYFFNHNIHPYQEYRRRQEAVQDFARASDLSVIYQDAYLLEDFLAEVAADPSSRCAYCYQSRLQEVARLAAANGYQGFSTSLLYSRYQNHNLIRELGEELGRLFGVDFIYEDFRTGWQEGIATSKSMGLYRQQYCGCIYSEKDRYYPRSSN